MTIDDIKSGDLKLTAKDVEYKAYYRSDGRRMPKTTKTLYFLEYKNGDKRRISHKILKEILAIV